MPQESNAMKPSNMNRRSLMLGGLSAGGLLLSSPALQALGQAASSQRRMVLVQLSGGNDGLSTVVPYGDDEYHRLRPKLARTRTDVLPIDDYRGLHKELGGLKKIYDAGQLAIVEGVGFPDPVRSHFMALEVWHTADRRGRIAGDGWANRLMQTAWPTDDHPELAVHLGGQAPYSMHSTRRPVVALQSPTTYRWFGDTLKRQSIRDAGSPLDSEAPAKDEPRTATGRDAMLARLRGVLDDADASSARIRHAAESYKPHVTYDRDPVSSTLRDVAALIHGGLGTRILSVSMGGFDTHANQRGDHDTLMRRIDRGLSSLATDLQQSAEGRETLIVVFSEFGRRASENGSGGTDHGKAGPMFILGQHVNGGLHGQHPSLRKLDEGDLRFNTDFRSVYGTVIETWFGIEHERVLGERYPLLPLLT